jgi:hypothetical protein
VLATIVPVPVIDTGLSPLVSVIPALALVVVEIVFGIGASATRDRLHWRR